MHPNSWGFDPNIRNQAIKLSFTHLGYRHNSISVLFHQSAVHLLYFTLHTLIDTNNYNNNNCNPDVHKSAFTSGNTIFDVVHYIYFFHFNFLAESSFRITVKSKFVRASLLAISMLK